MAWLSVRRPSHCRPRLLALLTILGGLAGCGGDLNPLSGNGFDHVILITIDTLRADHLGCYGYPRDTSPFLDRLAQTGARFERVVASSSHTAPAHASILTGQQPFAHGLLQNGLTLGDTVPTLAEHLGRAGIATGGFVSVEFLRGLSRGFDHFDARLPADNRARHGVTYRPAIATVASAAAWLRARTQDQPAFAWVHLYDVHESRADKPVAEEDIVSVRSSFDRPSFARFVRTQQGLSTHHDQLEKLDRYDAQIYAVDRALAAFHGSVYGQQSEVKALWIVTADHGEGLGRHGYWGHGRHLYQEQVRVPLIMRAFGPSATLPAVSQGGLVLHQLVRHVDLMPTILELLGAPVSVPKGPLEGRSLMSLMRGERERARIGFSQRRFVDKQLIEDHGWAPGEVFALQTLHHKIIGYSQDEDEAFDLDTDPLEDHDLGSRSSPDLDRLRVWIEGLLAAAERRQNAGLDFDSAVDPAFRDELRSLGYL